MGFLDDLGQAVGAFVSAAADAGSAIIESVAEAGASAVESVSDAAATVVKEASDLLAGTVEGVANVVGGGLDAVFGAGSGDGVRRAGSGLADVIRRGGRSAGGFIRAAGRMAAGWIRQGGRMLASFIFRIIGPSRLIATHSQWNARSPISGIARSRAEGFNISDVSSQYDYSDSGVYYEVMLNDQGQVQFRRGKNADNWSVIVPDRSTYDGAVTGPVAISYQNRRGTGSVEPKHEPGFDIAPAPAFEMIAAGENRIFAKEAGTDNFYIAAMVRDFLHFRKQAFDAPVDVPGFYSKLDPEFGTRRARFDDLLLIDKNQYNRHISLANFLLYNIGRRLDPLSPPARPLPLLLRLLRNVLLRLWDEVRPDMMLVRFDPGIWHLIDSRPPKGSGKLPEWLDSANSYRHVDYGWDWGRAGRIIERSEQSIKFRKVLGMGVGRLHRHTHYTACQGGELHVLAFNMGPIGDFASFFDGTCNYYLLCQIKEGPLEKENRQAFLRDAYGLLWIDEQTYYSERWRLVHPGDNQWGSFFRGMVTFAGMPPEENFGLGYEPYRDDHRYPSDCLLDLERFWCPFRNGFIHAGSRLALARQTCLVSGRVPPDFHDSSFPFESGEHLLFSLVFSWGSIDRTWRWRRLPHGCRAVILAEEDEKALLSERASAVNLTPGTEDVCYPQLIGLRDDMTITLRGVKTIGGQRQEGYWVQKYLPADNEEVPFLDETAGAAERKDQLSRFGTENLPPKDGYGHAWRFVPKDAFDRIRRYSHWGHYGKVDSRSQYYELFVEASSAVSAAELEAALSRDDHAPRWLDFEKRLSVHYPWLNYSAVEDLFVSVMPTEPLFRTTHQPPSFFNEFLYLKILNRPAWPVPGTGRGDGKKGFRFIATLWDKRDDDLAALQPRPDGPVSLLADFPPDSPLAGRVLTVRLGARRVVWKAPVVQKAVLSVYPGRQRITLYFTSVIQRRPRYLQHWKRIEDYMGMGVDRIAGFLRDSLGLDPEHPLGALDYDRWLHAEIFSREPDAVPFEIDHDPDRVDPCAAAGYPCPDMTIHCVRVQALDQNTLFDKFDLPVSVFTGRRRERRGRVEFIFSKTWNFDDRKEFEAVSRFLVEPGIHTHATSVVFEDLVGHVATPESMEFVIRRG